MLYDKLSVKKKSIWLKIGVLIFDDWTVYINQLKNTHPMLSEDLDEIEKLTASLSAMVDDEVKFKQSSNEILEHLSQDNTENISN